MSDVILLSPEQVSEILGIAVGTLAQRRVTGIDSPPFIRIGSRVYYDKAELEAWIASLPRQRSTSENPPTARRPRGGRPRRTRDAYENTTGRNPS